MERKATFEENKHIESSEDIRKREAYLSEIRQQILSGQRGLNPLLGERVEICEGRGPIGWQCLPNELPIRLFENFPSKRTIIACDSLAKCVGYDQAFFQLHEAAAGGPGFAYFSWILQFLISYAAEKGLDHLISKLKTEEIQKQAEIIALDFGKGNNTGEVIIRAQTNDNKLVEIHIPRYPSMINEINKEEIEELEKVLQKPDSMKYMYDRKGHRFVHYDRKRYFFDEEV